MKSMIAGAVAAAGSLALIGSAVVATAGPAGAAVGNGAYGAAAHGPIDLYPVANATVGNTPQVASNANIPGLLTTSTIVDRADTSGAWSRVNGGIVVNLPGSGRLQASGVRSWCRIIAGSVYGGARIFSGSVVQFGQVTVSLPTDPAPNTVINLPDGEGTITLNVQNDNAGEHGFAAIEVSLTDGQTVVLGVSGCYVTLPV